MARLAGAVAGAVLSLSGCGYGFAVAPGVAKVTAGRPVRVPPFENRSLEADVGITATQAASRQLAVRGVRLSDGAPVYLSGVIESVTVIPVFTTSPQQVALWRVDARLTLELRENGREKPLARTVVVDGQPYQPVEGNIEATEVSRRLAVQHLIEQMATRGIDQLNGP